MQDTLNENDYSLARRLWVYQAERFPVFSHGILILCFSYCAISFSAQLLGLSHPTLLSFIVAFLSSFISFLHLRIADEFKDFREDCRYRPYRPIPRGLISLKNLSFIWFSTAVIQLILALILDANLIWVLLLTWFYLALMSKEFFMREWLIKRPITYLLSHMLIMPLIDFYATACNWLPNGYGIPNGLFLFVIVSFFNGITIEIGRKLRSPQDEENGVRTYSALWGHKAATITWIGVMALTALNGVIAASLIHFTGYAILFLCTILLTAAIIGIRFIKNPSTKNAKLLEPITGLWTLVLYLTLGVFPLIIH